MAQGAHRGRPVAAAPCSPGLRPAKSPLRGTFDLSLQASGRAEAASVQNTALSPHPCGLPRPSGNVSAILRPSAPAVSVTQVGRSQEPCRPGKAIAATRHKIGSVPAVLARRRCACAGLQTVRAGCVGRVRRGRHPAKQVLTQNRVTNGAVSGRAMVVEAFSCGVPR